MSDRMLANRYAEALFWAARDAEEVDRVGDELANLNSAIRATPALHGLLSHPGASVERKMDGVRRVFGDSFSAHLASLLRVLLERQRFELLFAIGQHYQELVNRWRQIVPAEARSVIPLTDEQRARMENALNKLVSGRVALESRVDPSILGGVVVRLSDRIIDGSARHRLERLRVSLTHVEGVAGANQT